MAAFLFVLFVGLVIRLILIGNPGFVADISFWKSWGLAAIDHGIVWTSHNTNINYPPGFIYILWLMGKLYSIFADPHDFNNFWRENNFLFLFVSKSIPIATDTAIACLLYWFASQKEKLKKLGASLGNLTSNLPLLLSSVFFLNPIVIIDSALWGQVESLGLLFTISAIILLFYRRPHLATVIFTIGTLMKLQNIIFIPIYFLFIFRYFDLPTTVRSIAVAVATFFLVNLPFVLARDMQQVLYLMTVNSDYFPLLSLNAHNFWWIVAKAAGMQTTDKITVFGILNAKTVGLFLFSSFYLLSSLLVFLKPTPRNFLLSLTTAIFAFFLFTTQSHERYSYPVIVLLLFFYPFIEQKFGKNSKHEIRSTKQIQMTEIQNSKKSISNFEFRISNFQLYFWILYTLLSITIFFNIHTGLVFNYPYNGINDLTLITTPTLTIVNSYLLILLFLLLLPYLLSQISPLFLVLSSLFFVLSLSILNLSYIVKGKVSLTTFKPIIIRQDYGTLQVNRAVNSYSGWKSWSRLSNNYFYYRKGFGTHANSNLVFDVNRKFTKFTTDFGIDTEAPTEASVIFEIWADGKLLFSSGKMGRFDFPKHLEANISGVKYLGLVTTDAGDGINSDHADWLNPILYK